MMIIVDKEWLIIGLPFFNLNRGSTHKNRASISVASGRGCKDGMAPS